MEETGLVVTGDPVLVAAQDLMKVSPRHVVRLTYIGSADGEVRLSDEHIEYQWLAIDDIRALPDLGSNFKKLLEDGTIDRAIRAQAIQ